MKKKFKIVILLQIWCCMAFANHISYVRTSVILNRDWKYAQGDKKDAWKMNYDDSKWEIIGIPHSFSIPYFMSKGFYTGYGWYRKQLYFSSDDLKRQISLEFDGVFQDAEIFVNGHKAGHHVGGYTGFSIDITHFAKKGNNVIAVRVNNLWRPDVAPRAGEYIFCGGIYRDVRLIITSPIHVGWYGTYVTTPGLKDSRGLSSPAVISTTLDNQLQRSVVVSLKTSLVSPEGKTIDSVTDTVILAKCSEKTINQSTSVIMNPELWSPEHPVEYKIISSLYQGEKLVDRYETSFGFRWFKWTSDKGFYLNGKHRVFRGVNVHQDQAGWGNAVTDSAAARDVQMMKDAGFDFIRGSHYPHSPAFVHACDHKGMMYWSEVSFWGIGGFKSDGYWNSSAYPVKEEDQRGFEKNVLQQLSEMIHIFRNDPSVIVWSMCNEVFFSVPSVMDKVRSLLRKMVILSHKLDPTRPTAIGGAQRPLGSRRIDHIGDLAGYNGDGATQPDFQNPGVPNVVSEYGSVTSDRPGTYSPGWGDLKKNDGWKGFTWRSGQAIWCGFDHGSIAGSTLGKMGIIDYFRIPKRSWYWYRNTYRHMIPPKWPEKGIPYRLRLTSTKYSDIKADGTDDVQLLVTVCDSSGHEVSNTPTVTLTLVSGPGEFPTGTSITFKKGNDIRIMDGKASITFRSYYSGISIIKASSPGLKPSYIQLSFVDAPLFIKGKTPEFKEHPYVPYRNGTTDHKTIQVFGVNNPTFASSASKGHSAGFAADGYRNTYWQATENDKKPTWTLDTEKELSLRNISIQFPKLGVYQYKLEISDDKNQWSVLKDLDDNENSESFKNIKMNDRDDIKARFIRIVFKQGEGTLPAAISEVKVEGAVQ